MKFNIQQIANIAQVSKGTVSKVINNTGRVSQETRSRIQKLMEQLNYVPDASARALATQRTGIIGFLIPHKAAVSLAGSYWSMVLTGISDAAGKLGYHVLVLNPKEEVQSSNENEINSMIHQVFKKNFVDGLIIGSELLDKKTFSTLLFHNFPFVLLGQHHDFHHYCIDDDSTQGVQIMLDHMIKQGYKNIGGVFGPLRYPYVRERYESFQSQLKAQGYKSVAMASCEYSTELVADVLHEFFDKNPTMDALFVASGGEFLMDVMYVLRARKIKVPDFGIGVFDDYPFLSCMTPPVTAVQQPLLESGARAMQLLYRLINGESIDEQLVRLQNTLTIRESCGETPQY